jgi:hypothetical protein
MEPQNQSVETAESLLGEIEIYAKDYGISHLSKLTQRLREMLSKK